MKRFLLSAVFLFISFVGLGQCPQNNELVLTSQLSIDEFIADYPDCTQLATLFIEGETITNLESLLGIIGVSEAITIQNCPNLTNLSGLNAIANAPGDLIINNNESLVNLNGLNITAIESSAIIQNNPNLVSIAALSSTSISAPLGILIRNNPSLLTLDGLQGAIRATSVEIDNNDSLENLNGFLNLTEDISTFRVSNNVGLLSLDGIGILSASLAPYEVEILNNPALINISDLSLQDFTFDNNRLVIDGNTSLSLCSTDFMCNLLSEIPSEQTTVQITNNAPDCNTILEIQDVCDNCPLGEVIFSSQEEVNAFSINFPDCTTVYGIIIDGEDITDLTPLLGVNYVVGDLTIRNNDQLASLDGLQNIVEVLNGGAGSGGIRIVNNILLTSLSGLGNLSRTTKLEIRENDALVSLEGLSSLEQVSDNFSITGNASLTAINNFNALEEVNRLIIVDNDNLMSLNGFATASFSSLSISTNPSLINLVGLEGGVIIDGTLNIEDNEGLVNLEGLSNIQSINELSIINNPSLQNLEGFTNLTTITTSLNINANQSLNSLDGIEGVIETGGNTILLTISGNENLTDISPLNNLSSSDIENLIITDNISLGACDETFICDYLESTGPANIMNNAFRCETIDQATEFCGNCPNLGVLSSQADVDYYLNFLECITIEGDLVIEGSDITDLSPLSNITDVLGSVIIQNNLLLTNLNGIDGLTSFIGEQLVIANNPLLTTISSLGNLVNSEPNDLIVSVENNPSLLLLDGLGSIDFTAVNEFYITNNDNLLNLEGLENITFLFSLFIENNENLTSLSGLNNYNEGMDISIIGNPNLLDVSLPSLMVIHFLSVSNNQLLENLNGFSSLETVFTGISLTNNNLLANIDGLSSLIFDSGINQVTITGNIMLNTCNNDFVCAYIANGGNAEISNNASGCNSVEEVDQSCRPCDFPVILNSQADVDNFPGLYANCPEGILNGLTISGDDIVDLSPLDLLVNVQGGLLIQSNSLLENLQGLESLQSADALELMDNEQLSLLAQFSSQLTIGELRIRNNPLLIDLNGLNAISNVGDLFIESNEGLVSLNGFPSNQTFLSTLYVQENAQLNNLNGLSNITEISSAQIIDNGLLTNLNGLENVMTITNEIIILDNSQLLSFEGLGSLEVVSSISISNNSLLSDISQLANVNSTSILSLTIQNNNQLEICSNLAVCNYLNIGGSVTISNNDIGCNSESEVFDSCSFELNTLTGTIGFDFNNDGCDVSDYDASNILVTTTDGSNSFTSITDEEGFFELFVGEGTHTSSIVNASLPNGFTGIPNTIETTFIGLGDSEEISFCVEADEDIVDVSLSLIPLQEPRPGVPANYVVQYENLGTQVATGDITFNFNEELMFFVGSDQAPSNIESNSITWIYTDLLPFESSTFLVTFELFIPPVVDGGELLSSLIEITPIDDDVDIANNSSVLRETVVNSFDPNDKQVLQGPEIFEEQVGEFLDYLVRFQNTGTADALEVIITDILSDNLNWNTLRILNASHEYRVEITNGNEVAFIFEDINLPPEELDPDGSNGYIAFEIRSNIDLQLGDAIENTANIFFDFNAPIITNTVVTTVVEPLGVDDFLMSNVRVFPNPVSDLLQINIPQEIQFEKAIVLSLQGQKVAESELPHVDMSTLASGIYFVKIKTTQGEVTKKIVKN